MNFKVYSDSDRAGVTIQTGQNYKFKNPFSFTVNTDETVGTSLHVANGDTVYVQYDDCTLPVADDKFGFTYGDDECMEVIAKTLVLTH